MSELPETRRIRPNEVRFGTRRGVEIVKGEIEKGLIDGLGNVYYGGTLTEVTEEEILQELATVLPASEIPAGLKARKIQENEKPRGIPCWVEVGGKWEIGIMEENGAVVFGGEIIWD